ncbi:MAG TPA: Sec-independent protein translocase subunit TatA [Pseudonocardiaceae bacterium]|nr:Sec-independent protein translocase subunit TatA [Pseudonocardiaceae bacterium]
MLNGFGWPHLLIIAVLIIVLFGAKRLPDAARGIGKSMRIFKAETRGLQDDDAAANPGTTPAPPQQIANQQQSTSAPFATPTPAEQANGQVDQQQR